MATIFLMSLPIVILAQQNQSPKTDTSYFLAKERPGFIKSHGTFISPFLDVHTKLWTGGQNGVKTEILVTLKPELGQVTYQCLLVLMIAITANTYWVCSLCQILFRMLYVQTLLSADWLRVT
jgi:hypothetical protein